MSNPKTRNQLVFLFCGTRHFLAKYDWLKSSFKNSEYNLVPCAAQLDAAPLCIAILFAVHYQSYTTLHATDHSNTKSK